jgi:hypothetical protein
MPSHANHHDHNAFSMMQPTTPSPSVDWQLIRTSDRPIVEDTWIASVLQNDAQRQRWRAWHERPRYAVANNVGPWAVIAVVFRECAGDNALLELFRNMDAQVRAVAWAVSKATGQIYRLAMHLPAESLTTPDVAEAVVAAEPEPERDVHPHLPSALRAIPPESWQDAVLRAQWEAHLVIPAHWVLSQCHRRLMRVAQPGEFGAFGLSEQLSHIGALFDGVLELETLPVPRHQRLYERLYRRERMLATAVLKRIAAALDPELVQQTHQARIAGGVSAVSLNWLAAVARESPARQRRLQALRAAPVLLPWLLGARQPIGLADVEANLALTAVGDNDDAIPARAAQLSDVLDSGAPLYPMLAQLTGLSVRTVRHLRLSLLRIHHVVERLDHRAQDHLLPCLRWLDAISVEHWPDTPSAWRGWASTIKALWSQCDLVAALLTPPLHRWIADVELDVEGDVERDPPPERARGGIALAFYRSLAARRWRLRLATAYDLPEDADSAHTLALVGMELNDWVRALREAASGEWDDFGEPALLPLPGPACALLAEWQIEQWWAASQRWHAALTAAGIPREQHGAPNAPARETQPWLPLLAHPFRVGGELGAVGTVGTVSAANVAGVAGVGRIEADTTAMHGPMPIALATVNREAREVRFLTSAEMLNEEAAAMRHCVGTYARRCVAGRWHVASLVDGTGARASTVAFQLCFMQGRWVAELVEHRGALNAAPSVQCVQAVRTLVALLAKPVMQGRYIAVEAARVERAAMGRGQRFAGNPRGSDVSLAALRVALPVNVFEALVAERI